MENSWNNIPIQIAVDFLKLLLTFDDGQQFQRLDFILCHPKYGLATIVMAERQVVDIFLCLFIS